MSPVRTVRLMSAQAIIRCMGCTYEDCLHLLELKRGEPLICKKKPSEKILTVRGQEKWFSQIASEVGNRKVQSLSMLLVRATCI